MGVVERASGATDVEPTNPPAVRPHRQSTPLAQALAATGDRWTLLIVLALSDGAARLNVVRGRLPGVSSAVLDHHVRRMVALGLLSRRRFREMPPRVELQLTESGAALLPAAGALARWGMRHRWSVETGCERIDADAVLHQLPALLEETKLPEGTIEAVLDDGCSPHRYRFEIVDGRLAVAPTPDSAQEPQSTSARIEGDAAGWAVALGPQRDHRGVRIEGRRRLAKQMLEALPH
ncbi:MAG TPA: helix-turn-helix domain-containing protein [Solirubrobacteraceae bacterium]|jgi:DNA-binding HxlR family transcriptional regulator|nr:helix-turn-helix domain-containing protein [Solirubrobacteraceae bacterium]